MPMRINKTALFLLFVEVVLVVLFWIFVRYEPQYLKKEKYPMFQDVHVMMFLGFGYLLSFFKRYGYSSTGLTMLYLSYLVQWAIICQGFLNLNDNFKIEVGISSMYEAEIAAAAVLISYCAIIGQSSIIQVFVMGFIEIVIYFANAYLITNVLKVADAGGSIFIHVFGAYFGLSVSYVMAKRQQRNVKQEATANSLKESSYTSDIFAMIGTVFLWLYWPSFNAIELDGLQQERAILNTYLALASCCLSTFAASLIFSSDHKFDMVHIQNGTLAGGVAVGAAAHLMLQPSGALIVGLLAGLLCVIGFEKLTPLLEKKLNFPDTCGINNLHGMPGILSGLVSAVMASMASENDYHEDLYEIFPARGMSNQTSSTLGSVSRGAGMQAAYQILGIVVAVAMAAIFGTITGLLLSCLEPVHPEQHFNDTLFWKMPESSPIKVRAPEITPMEDLGNHHDNLGFEISILEGETMENKRRTNL